MTIRFSVGLLFAKCRMKVAFKVAPISWWMVVIRFGKAVHFRWFTWSWQRKVKPVFTTHVYCTCFAFHYVRLCMSAHILHLSSRSGDPCVSSEAWMFHQQALQEYLLLCCQSEHGGLIDKPGKCVLFKLSFVTSTTVREKKYFHNCIPVSDMLWRDVVL